MTIIGLVNICRVLSSTHVHLTERNGNGGFKRWRVKSCSSANTTLTMAMKLGRVVIYYEELPPIKTHDPLIAWSYEIT